MSLMGRHICGTRFIDLRMLPQAENFRRTLFSNALLSRVSVLKHYIASACQSRAQNACIVCGCPLTVMDLFEIRILASCRQVPSDHTSVGPIIDADKVSPFTSKFPRLGPRRQSDQHSAKVGYVRHFVRAPRLGGSAQHDYRLPDSPTPWCIIEVCEKFPHSLRIY